MGRTWLLIAPLKQMVSPHRLFSKGGQSRQDTYDAVEEAVAAVAAVASVLRLTGTLLSDCVKANGVWDLNGLVWPTALRAVAAWRLRSMVRVGKKKKKVHHRIRSWRWCSSLGSRYRKAGGRESDESCIPLGKIDTAASGIGRRESGCLWTVGGGYLVFYRDQMKFWSPNRV